ncbi:hypothetical protein M569_07273, partial [Genlisea aurea]
RISRALRRKENTLYNALRSIYEDSIFVGEISQLWPELPLVANLRCGLWYSPKFDATCYYKSTDGHANNLSFSISRLNLHVAILAGNRGGCIIVDSTRKGKRFPDSMSKTIPIWTCVINRAIFRYRKSLRASHISENMSSSEFVGTGQDLSDWDCTLHLPLWVSDTEKAKIEKLMEQWIAEFESCGADICSVSSSLKKPLRPLWISQRTVIWLNEVPEYDSWDFTPIILVSSSHSSDTFYPKTTSEFSWNYIAGAGDDEEGWARGLTPRLFWEHANEIIASGPELCNRHIANIIEKSRVWHSLSDSSSCSLGASFCDNSEVMPSEDSARNNTITILGSTNIAIGKSELISEVPPTYCILNCYGKELSVSKLNTEAYLCLPFVDFKRDRFSVLRNLPHAFDFAKKKLQNGEAIFICCNDGEDISICVCLAILTSLYDGAGEFDDGKWFDDMQQISKAELRKRLVFICKYAVNARPSRGNLKQVFAYL